MAKNGRKKKDKESVDLRKVPRDKRPKPTTGQSAEAHALPWDALSGDERVIIKLLDGDHKAASPRPRTVRSIEYLAEGLEGDAARLRARNALRRPVACGWVDRAARARYQISELGRRRLAAERG
jgi:hypothetical protein